MSDKPKMYRGTINKDFNNNRSIYASYEDRDISSTDTSTDELSTLYNPKQYHMFLEVVYAEIWYVQILW